MSLKFEFKIDYEKLTALLNTFLKSHSDELTSIMGKCLVLQPSSSSSESPAVTPPPPPPLPPQLELQAPLTAVLPIHKEEEETDHTVDNRPLIGDSIPEDPLQNLFSPNPNSNTTRYQDRNNPNIKKGFRNH